MRNLEMCTRRKGMFRRLAVGKEQVKNPLQRQMRRVCFHALTYTAKSGGGRWNEREDGRGKNERLNNLLLPPLHGMKRKKL